jgi:dUTPase
MQKLFKSKIKSISKIESQEMFDITVSKNHNLFYNKLLVHNCDYRGELGLLFTNTSNTPYKVSKGDRIAQGFLLPVLQFKIEEVNEISETIRGEGGFGSTGK